MGGVRAIVVLLVGCASGVHETAETSSGSPTSTGSMPIPPVVLTGDHASLACRDAGCLVARPTGNALGLAALDPGGVLLADVPAGELDWNHPQAVALDADFAVVAATAGPLTQLRVAADGRATDPLPLTDGTLDDRYPDLARGDDGRLCAIWSGVDALRTAIYDPDGPASLPIEWTLELADAQVDPPAVAAVPGGYVLGWTEVNDVEWLLRLRWVNLGGTPIGDPVAVARGPSPSRGARPQLAGGPDGSVAVAWRIKRTEEAEGEGAFLQVFEPQGAGSGAVLRLDGSGIGNRPTVTASDTGWVVAWDEPDGIRWAELTPGGSLEGPAAKLADEGLRPDIAVTGARIWFSWEVELPDGRTEVHIEAVSR